MSGHPSISIAGRMIGADHAPYIIAEMSGNHNGDLSRALAIVEAAKQAGADAVKMQTYTADTITIDHDGPGFSVKGTLWEGRTLHDLYDEAHTPWAWHEAIFGRGRELGIPIFSSPFDGAAIDLLERLNCPAYKIASFEMVDLQLIQRAAATGKPVIISTGLASADEIREAVSAAQQAGCRDTAVLHCISSYPTEARDCNLQAISTLASLVGTVVGFSDHTLGSAVPVAAVALGASVIEKHMTLSRADGGPDSAFSLEPDEMRTMVADCRFAWQARGNGGLERPECEQGLKMFRRSLYVVEDIGSGESFSETNVRSIRPGHGLPPKHLPEVIGKSAAMDLKRGTPLTWDAIKR